MNLGPSKIRSLVRALSENSHARSKVAESYKGEAIIIVTDSAGPRYFGPYPSDEADEMAEKIAQDYLDSIQSTPKVEVKDLEDFEWTVA